MSFSKIIVAGLMAVSVFSTFGLAAPLAEDATSLEARDSYSLCVEGCIERFAAGPNREACWARCSKMHGGVNAKTAKKGRRSLDEVVEIVERSVDELERRDSYSLCVEGCIERFGPGPNREACWARCSKMHGGVNAKNAKKGRRSLDEDVEIVERTVDELERRDSYSLCVEGCIERFAAGPNREACWARCSKMHGGVNAKNAKKGRRSLDIDELATDA